MRIVIAPDKFKGTLTADEVAEAMAVGVARAVPDAETILCPVADGGEGTTSIFLSALGGKAEHVSVRGPVGGRVQGVLGHLPDGTTIVESASATGLGLVPAEQRDALLASSEGTGDLLAAALARASGPTRVVVAVGGTASTDGGTGAASALGWRFVDEGGDLLRPGGGDLRRLARIEQPEDDRSEVPIVGACDVESPLTGPLGAATVFSPQKGASPREVAVLEEGLENLQNRLRVDLGVDLEDVRHAGAGGGLGAGIIAFFHGTLEAGFGVVAEAVGLEELIETADLVLTGEGRLDEQSLRGKCAIGVAGLARARGVPCGAIAGEVVLRPTDIESAGITRCESLVEIFGPGRARNDAGGCVAAVTCSMVASTLG